MKEKLLQEISDAIYEMDEDHIVDICKRFISAGYEAEDALNQGLIPGMMRVGQAYDEEEYFVTDMLFASDTLYLGLDYLEPFLVEGMEAQHIGSCVIGNVEGDTHDIGKNLVKTMMEAAGFEMIDLGKDVPTVRFIEQAIEHDVDIVCISTLMTTTLPMMQNILEELERQGLRDRFKVMVGGGPVTEKFAQEIGADGYSENATEAVALARRLMGVH